MIEDLKFILSGLALLFLLFYSLVPPSLDAPSLPEDAASYSPAEKAALQESERFLECIDRLHDTRRCER
ncbi:MAG: hypothetical protein KGL39_41215 [Patescibacteria group bacterium]|nr:hypothetical protein [Patescibacteria group bacterium]